MSTIVRFSDRQLSESRNTSRYFRHYINGEPATIVYGITTQVNSSDSVVPQIPEELRLLFAIFLFVVFVIGIAGNFIVIWIFSRTKALRTLPHNLLIINLACSDLLMVFTMFPAMFIAVAKKKWIFGQMGCDAYAFCGSLFGIGSLCILTAIAYDRRCAICNNSNMTAGSGSYRRVFFLIVVSWLYAFLWSVLPLTGQGGFVLEGYYLNCSFDYLNQSLQNRIYVGLLFTGAFFIPMSIIMYSYICVVLAVRKSRHTILDMGKSNVAGSQFRRHKRKVKNYETAKIGMKLITLFILSWGPYASVAFIGQFINPTLIFPLIQLIPVVMAKSASVWNPIVYAISHRRFKRELRTIFLDFCCAGVPVGEPTSQMSTTSNNNINNGSKFKEFRVLSDKSRDNATAV